jgi:hypothetical protein
VLDIAFAIPPDWPQHVLALVALAFLAATSHFTAVQRLVYVLQSLPGKKFQPPTVGYRLRRALAGVIEIGTVAALVAFDTPWIAAAAIACATGLAAATSDPDRYRRVFVALSSAALLAGAMWLLQTTGGLTPLLAWVIARFAIHLTWVVPNELPRHLVDPAAKPQ